MIMGRDNDTNSRTPWGKAFTVIALLLLFSLGSAWAGCTGGGSWTPLSSAPQVSCKIDANWGADLPLCTSLEGCTGGVIEGVGNYAGSYFYDCYINWSGRNICGGGNYGTTVTSNRETVCSTRCTDKCSADSLACLNKGDGWKWDSENCECKEQCQDSTWYHCESVFTENNVVRSEVSQYNCDSLVSQQYLLGACGDNGFCNGKGKPGLDSCSYNNPLNCKSAGQSGSLCSYVCSDGSFRSCNIPWVPGQPSEYQNCPSSMPSGCGGRSSSSGGGSSSSAESSSSEGSSSSGGGDSSSSGGGDEDCPECEILQAIKDTLHMANVQRKVQTDYTFDIKNSVEEYIPDLRTIATNTNITAVRINTTNGLLEDIDSTNKRISTNLDNLDLGNLTATVDSIVVHVDTPSDSSSAPWVFWDLDSLPVWRDTVSDIHRTLDSIKVEIDSLNKDTTGIIGKYLPFLKKMSDKLDDLTGDCEGVECVLRPAIDTLVTKMRDSFGLDTFSLEEQSDTENGIVRLTDSTYLDGNWYCIEHPNDDFCVELDSTQLPSIRPPDSLDLVEFLDEQDSIMRAIDSLMKDTTKDTLPLDELAGDSALIREKLDFLFFPSTTLEQCFEFRMNSTLNGWAVNLLIDFADIFGWDFCDLIRKIVRLITFILIVFTTIKGYIKAFGGSGGD